MLCNRQTTYFIMYEYIYSSIYYYKTIRLRLIFVLQSIYHVPQFLVDFCQLLLSWVNFSYLNQRNNTFVIIKSIYQRPLCKQVFRLYGIFTFLSRSLYYYYNFLCKLMQVHRLYSLMRNWWPQLHRPQCFCNLLPNLYN